MRLRYENTLDDLVAFCEFHYARSRSLKRTVWAWRWIVGLIIFLVIAVSPSKHGPWFRLFQGSVCSAVWILIFPPLVRNSNRRQARSLLNEGTNRGYAGEHELEILEDGIVERTAYNEMKTSWGAVERIEGSPDRTFIYIGSVMAHIIPHSRVIEGDRAAFLAELGKRFQPDKLLPPIEHT